MPAVRVSPAAERKKNAGSHRGCRRFGYWYDRIVQTERPISCDERDFFRMRKPRLQPLLLAAQLNVFCAGALRTLADGERDGLAFTKVVEVNAIQR